MQFSNNIYWDFLALIAGILFTLAFAPFDYSYLAVIGLAVLFASWQNATPGRAVLRGYLFGLGSFGLGVSWVYISIHDFGHAGIASAGLLTGLFVGFWALFPALAGGLSAKIKLKSANLIIAPLIWILIEYFRGVIVLNGFPWLLGAYSQLESPLAGYIPIIGAYGTDFLLASTAAVIVFLFQATKNLPLLPAAVVAVVAVVWGAGGLLQTVAWTETSGEPIRVSLIQGSITQDQKWLPENRSKTLLLYKKLTEAHWDSAVIIWPETAIPAFLSEVYEPFLLPLSNVAKQHNTDLIISVPIQDDTTGEIYNGVITLGKHTGMYRKNHLLPFGEYLPWQPLSGFVLNAMNINLGNFTPGGIAQPLLKAASYPFITSICYEDAFGDAGIAGLPDAAFLVNVTNDGWFGDSIEPHQHLQIARMRAMETGRYLLRATNTGATAFVAPDGKIIKQAPLFKATVLTESISPMRGMTPYARLGDKAVIYALALLLAGMISYDRRFFLLPKSGKRV